jgi:hypothetical protein
MKNALIILGLSVASFGTGMIYSSDIPSVEKKIVSTPPPVQNEVKMVDGMELVFVTEDGKMIFKRAKVPANSMTMEDFTHYMKTRQRPSPINNAGVD